MKNLAPLRHWIETESPSRDAAGVNAMMDLVAADLTGMPVGVERVLGRDGLGDHLVVKAGPERNEKAVLILSHLDTVHPLGTKLRQLPVRVADDRLYGPGVYDMKGGAWLALEAFKDVVRQQSFRRPLVFVFTADEEIGSPTSRGLIEEQARNAAYALVTEPARDGGKIVTARKGVGRFEVHIEGRPSHSGTRHAQGRSAIKEAARQILAIEAMTDYAVGVTTSVNELTGGTAPNVIPQHAWFSVDMRAISPEDGKRVEAAILGLKAHDLDVKLRVTGGLNRPPMPKTAEIAALFAHAEGLASQIGFKLEDQAMTGGGSDGNFTAALGVPTLDGLGIDGDGAHTLDEYALISSIAPRRRLMTRLLETL